MIIYQKTKDKITKITKEVFNVKKLNAELKEIEKKLKDLEKEPDEILMPNDSKFQEEMNLNNRKEEITKILN